MKTLRHALPLAALAAAAALSFEPSTRAAITGQWDFKAGNLNATIGADMGYLDAPTQTGTVFGSTTGLGVPNINGQATNVMRFPKLNDEFGGYNAPHGAAGNGGGGNVNQYTVIMDVLFPPASAGKTRTLFVTDLGGEFQINAGDALAVSGGTFGGNVSANVWHRLAVTVDTTNTITL